MEQITLVRNILDSIYKDNTMNMISLCLQCFIGLKEILQTIFPSIVGVIIIPIIPKNIIVYHCVFFYRIQPKCISVKALHNLFQTLFGTIQLKKYVIHLAMILYYELSII